LKAFLETVTDPQAARRSVRVAAVIGTVLFTINHGPALLGGEMRRDRWISAGFTYIVPFLVSIHGQSLGRRRSSSNQQELHT
jgi:hypothetical protein